MPFLMIRNDITRVHADAVVNPANEQLEEGSGTSRGIYLGAGEALLKEACRKIGYCRAGSAVVTPAFGLPAKYIIHAVGTVWIDGNHGEEEILYGAYINSLKLAEEYGLESIAFPLLCAGNYGYPKELALRIAVRAVSDFLMETDMMIYLVLYNRNAVVISKKLFASVEEYIDDHYVEQKDEIYRTETPRFQRFSAQGNYVPEAPLSEASAPASSAPLPEASAPVPQASIPPAPISAPPVPERSLEQLMKRHSETFSQMLLRLIDERGVKDSCVYKKANVDRRHFSKIRNDINYMPNKRTVVAFAIALELTMDETRDLLMRAGYAFSCCSKFDVIVSFFIENRKYDIFEINEILFKYGQPVLGE